MNIMKTWILTTSYLNNSESVGIVAENPPEDFIEDYVNQKAEEYYNIYGNNIENLDLEDYSEEDERFSEFMNDFEYSLSEGDISSLSIIYDE